VLGSDAIVEAFQHHGVSRIFIFPGGTIAPVLDSATRRGVEIYCARHEQGAGYAALATARLSGRPQVVMVTSGPGVTNLITSVADAYFDSTPLIVLTGQVGTGDMIGNLPLRQRGFQEVDTIALLRPVTKAQFLPKKPADLPDMMESAFEVAASGRPGPVVVDLPMNVQRGEVGEISGSGEHLPRDGKSLHQVDPAQIKQVLEWLESSRKPVILAGQGVLIARAQRELRILAEHCRIPVTQSLLGLGAFPTASPLALGFHGHTGNQYAGRALHEADLILVVGSRLDVRQTGSRFDDFGSGGRVVRIDLDLAELEHSRIRSDLNLHADARSALAALNAGLAGRAMPDWSKWRDRIDRWRKEFPLNYDMNGALKPQFVIETANRLTGDRPVICVSGVGSHQQWVARHFDFDYPTRIWLTSGGHGAMGFDLPVAIGSQLACPEAQVLCFVGDGSLQINIQELAAVAENKLPVKIIVLDNRRLGIVSQFQKFNWKSDPACGEKWNPDFAAIAAAYGITGLTVRSVSEVEPALKKAFVEPGPVLIHCLVDPLEDVVPMLMAGQTMDKMWPYE
jgi:acetolactate synthase-1/2/3 large subunit